MSTRGLLVAACALAAGCSKSPPGAAPSANDAAGPALDASTTSAEVGPADAGAPPAGPYNVLVISIDSLRADMPWSGYARPIAPRLQALHAKSVSYARAYATSSFTSKSVAGLLTGRYPSELTRTGTFFTRYLAKDEFLCTALDARGVPCVGAHAHAYFGKGQSGFDHGFREWRIVPGITFDYQTDPYVTSDKLTPLAIEILGKVDASRPFFAWFHYMDPHDQYKPHEESPKFGKKFRDLYDEEVFYTDMWIGRLLDWVERQPWADRTVTVVTADHGEAFGEHGMYRHAHELWEELVRVPLFFHVPGAAARVIDAPRGHVDLAPTFAELLGVTDVALPGKSLVAELRGGEAAPRDVVADLPQDDINERRRALIHGKTKLIAFGDDARFALYDLDADPGETDDLIKKRPELAAEMKQRYREVGKAIHDVPPRGGIPKRDRK